MNKNNLGEREGLFQLTSYSPGQELKQEPRDRNHGVILLTGSGLARTTFPENGTAYSGPGSPTSIKTHP